MPKFGNRVKETTDTTGTGTLDLSGAPTGFRSFDDEFMSGDAQISYLIVDNPDNPTEYEYGKGTFTSGTPDTFARNTVEGSSNGGSKVSFAAGTKTIIATPTAEDFNVFGGDGPWASKTAVVRAITASGNMLAADDGKLIVADGSGNSPAGLTYTLLAAATADDGFVVTIINTGASGSVVIDGNGSETINGATTLTLSAQYDVAQLRCDGTEWFVEHAPQAAASDTVAGLIEIAVQSEMESASSTTLAIPPGRAHYHPGVAKSWVKFDSDGNVQGQYPSGHTIDDDAAGEFGVNWPTPFSSEHYAVHCTAFHSAFRMAFIDAQVAGSADPRVQNTAGTDADPTSIYVVAFGDQ